MDISDFLPKYPNINKFDQDILNPYDDNFYQSIYHKKEFYDERLEKTEEFPTEKGDQLKHQKLIARFLSSNTIYDELLLVHEMGTGKTCSVIAAIEQIKNDPNSTIDGAYIFAKGTNLLNNFVKELRDKCTTGQYIPAEFKTEQEKHIRTRKLYEDFYSIHIGSGKTTFQRFSTFIKNSSDKLLINNFSNKILVIDEVHNLRYKETVKRKKKKRKIGEKKKSPPIDMYEQFKRFLHLVKNCKILLLSGTPMKDLPEEIASVMNLILPLDNQLPDGDEFVKKYLISKGDGMYDIQKDKIHKLKKKFKGRISFVKTMRSENVKKVFEPTDQKEKVKPLDYFVVKPYIMSKHQTESYETALKLDLAKKDVDDNKEKGKDKGSGVYSNSIQASLFVFPDGTYGSNGFHIWLKETGSQSTSLKQSIKKKIKQRNQDFGDEKKEAPSPIIYNFTSKFKKKFRNKTQEEKLLILSEYSIKYASIIRDILEHPNQNIFIYCDLVMGSGIFLFSKLLELFKYSEAVGGEKTKVKRYALMTDVSKIHKLKDTFNKRENVHGDIIQVIIGSRMISEGFSFYNVQREYILAPWYNYSETDQAIARGYRLGSHNYLLELNETPTLFITQCVAIPDKILPYLQIYQSSVDIFRYKRSENKDLSIRKIMRILMESAFDCALNYLRNHITGYDGFRDCDYGDCDYICDGFDNMDFVDTQLSDDQLDLSTYQLYYIDKKVPIIRENIEKLLKKYNNLSINDLIYYLGENYTEKEILYSIKSMLKEENKEENKEDEQSVNEKNRTYEQYKDTYNSSKVKTIIFDIESLFKLTFKLKWKTLQKNMSKYTDFELLKSLNIIINENITIKNKYGIDSYLRHANNFYFLINSLSVDNDIFSDYYTKYPTVLYGKSFKDMIDVLKNKIIPNIIDMICKSKSKSKFNKLMTLIPNNIQEIFIEASLIAKLQNVDTNIIVREYILEYFSTYIKNIKEGKFIVSTRLQDTGVIRCLNTSDYTWDNCSEDIEFKNEDNDSIQNILHRNPYGLYGTYNTKNKEFRIVDILAEKISIKEYKKDKLEKLEKKKGNISKKQYDIEFEKLESVDEKRRMSRGRVCTTQSLLDLINKIINILNIDPDPLFLPNITVDHLEKLVEYFISKETVKRKYISNYTYEKDSKTLRAFFKKKEVYEKTFKTIEELNEEYKNKLIKLLYFSISQSEWKKDKPDNIKRYIKNSSPPIRDIKKICNYLMEWFKNTQFQGHSLLIQT